MKRLTKPLNFNSKKGNFIVDSILIIVILFVFAIIAVLSSLTLGEINADVQNDSDLNNLTRTELNDYSDRMPTTFDALFILLFVLLWIFLLVSSYYIDTNPLFFIITFLIMAFVILTAAILSNSYEELREEGDIEPTAINFPMTNFILDKLPFVVIGLGASILLVLYAKFKE